jgi:hypothetical protein
VARSGDGGGSHAVMGTGGRSSWTDEIGDVVWVRVTRSARFA